MAVALLSSPTLDAVEFPLRWRWSNPAPHGGNVVDMAYSATLGLAVQVAERGQIYTSDDLSLWLPRDSHVTNSLRRGYVLRPADHRHRRKRARALCGRR
jgi:hypothetical protein